MNIVIIGTGYVGLVSGVLFAHGGHNVICVDNDDEKISKLSRGIPTIYETDLEQYLVAAITNGNIHFINSFKHLQQKHIKPPDNFAHIDIVFIAVGTPSLPDGKVDLSHVYGSLDDILSTYTGLIVIKSTVIPGTAIQIKNYITNKGYNNSIAVNPEFLREGSAIHDFLHPDRIVIGINNDNDAILLQQIYEYITKFGVALVITNPTTAEMIKYASNAFLATKISLINEMANLCERVVADVKMLSYGIGLDKRIGQTFTNPGPGFGGSCFPKDVLALTQLAADHQCPLTILETVIQSNKNRTNLMFNKILRMMNNNLNGKVIGVLGLTYKANTDDVRSSPALEIVKLLLEAKVKIKAYDPQGMDNAQKLLPQILYCSNVEKVCEDSNALLILTEWKEFANIDLDVIKSLLTEAVIIDLRNVLNADLVQAKGIRYECL